MADKVRKIVISNKLSIKQLRLCINKNKIVITGYILNFLS